MDEGAEMGYSFVALIMEDFLKAAVILATRGQEKFNELQTCQSLHTKGGWSTYTAKK